MSEPRDIAADIARQTPFSIPDWAGAIRSIEASGYRVVRADSRDAWECLEVRRLLGYLWTATGRNHLRPVHTLFDEHDPIRQDIERLAIFPEVEADA